MNQLINYANKYGIAQLITITDYCNIAGIRGKDISDENKYPIDTLEQLVLISENRNMQVSLGWPIQNVGYIIHHRSASEVAICRIANIDFFNTGINAREELARSENFGGSMHFFYYTKPV